MSANHTAAATDWQTPGESAGGRAKALLRGVEAWPWSHKTARSVSTLSDAPPEALRGSVVRLGSDGLKLVVILVAVHVVAAVVVVLSVTFAARASPAPLLRAG